MGDKECKALLKDAREFIKAKDYKSALREVKKVLNKDKNNYMGLVFCGLCLSELDQPEQALQAYTRATESMPDQLTAWEGLAKFYDKVSNQSQYRMDHIKCLEILVSLTQTEAERCYDQSCRLAQLQLDALDLEGAVHTLQAQAVRTAGDKEKHRSTLEMIVRILSQQADLSGDMNSVFEETLDSLISQSDTAQNMENLKHMIKLLYKMRKLEQLVATAVNMKTIFSENTYPLEWICKVYLEWVAGTLDFESEVLKDPSPYYLKLLQYSPNSSLGNLARGAHLCETRDEAEGSRVLAQWTNVPSPNVYGLYLLTRAQFAARNYAAVEMAAPNTIKYLDKVKEENTREKMQGEMSLLYMKALYHQGAMQKCEDAVYMLPGCDDQGSMPPDLGLLLAKVYATLGREDRLAKLRTHLQLDPPQAHLVEALLLNFKGQTESSEVLLRGCLEASPEDFEVLTLLGRIAWEQARKDDSLAYFLKAAKVDPGSWVPFLFLGHFYRDLGTPQALDKARKCYQKCLEVNPDETSAGKGLSDIYRITGKLQENLSFLTEMTGRSTAASGKSTWAWLRLGVHYLAADQPGQAVQALQAALRGDSGDLNCWEALADAYMARGSFTAAQKAFEKVLHINPDSVYARLMIAAIKDRVGKWRDAAADYREILLQSPEYLPALRGLGETLLSQAKNYLEEYIDRNAVECVEEALEVLTQAAELRPGLQGTWRLLGDCCSVLGECPSTMLSLQVPGKLVASQLPYVQIDKEKLLELGSRCYIRALRIYPENWRTWHQLGILYSHTATINKSREYKLKALGVMKHAVSLAPGLSSVWCSLGLVACQCEDWALAQHCFIKSLELEVSCGAWTSLGIVYLHLGHAQLANRALKEAQNHEPSNLRGWAGQAMVAEVAGFRSESMDLFRHCTFLGGEAESALGYAHWVLSTLRDIKNGVKVEQHNKYILEKMHGVTVAADSLDLYCRRRPHNSLAQCQLSVLLERQGLLRKSLAAAERASAELVSSGSQEDLLDKVLANIGRLQYKLGNFEKSVAAFKSIRCSSFYNQVGLGLSYFALGQIQESYDTYKSSFHWLTENDGLKSDILVAMGTLAYRVEGPQVAKTLLFQSCQMSPPSVRGILALCVLGIQSSDLGLIDAALAEMKAHEHDPRHAHDIAFLRASVMLLKGDVKGARRSLLRSVHNQPWLAGLWRVLSLFLLENCKEEAQAAASFSRKAGAFALEQKSDLQKLRHVSVVKGFKHMGSNVCSQLCAESLVVESLCLLASGDRVAARRAGSKLCHLYPHLAQSWAILTASGDSSCSWYSKVVALVQSMGDDQLTAWAARLT